jgi:hypothetical protein
MFYACGKNEQGAFPSTNILCQHRKLTCEKWKGKKGIKQELPARNIRQV